MIKIFSYNGINPEFVEPQLASFKKHLQEDFEFIVFNNEGLDARPDKAKEVSRICRSLSIPVIEAQRDSDVEAHWLQATRTGKSKEELFDKNGRFFKGLGKHAPNYTLQWGWDKVISKEQGPICYVHSDVFLVEPIKLTSYLQEQPLCFRPIGNLAHMYEALFLADIPKLPSPETIIWFPAFVEGEWRDSGGLTYYWLKSHPEIRRLHIGVMDVSDSPVTDFHPSRYQFFHLGDKKVFHYLAGSRWFTNMKEYQNLSIEASNEYHEKKLAWARRLIGITEAQ